MRLKTKSGKSREFGSFLVKKPKTKGGSSLNYKKFGKTHLPRDYYKPPVVFFLKQLGIWDKLEAEFTDYGFYLSFSYRFDEPVSLEFAKSFFKYLIPPLKEFSILFAQKKFISKQFFVEEYCIPLAMEFSWRHFCYVSTSWIFVLHTYPKIAYTKIKKVQELILKYVCPYEDISDFYNEKGFIILEEAEKIKLFQQAKKMLVSDCYIEPDFMPKVPILDIERKLQDFQKEQIKRICPLCGEEIKGKIDKKYCSEKCKQRLWRIRQLVKDLKKQGRTEAEIKKAIQNRRPWSKPVFDLDATLKLALEEI